jgi:hypothetical protein
VEQALKDAGKEVRKMSWRRRPVDAKPLNGRDHAGAAVLPAAALAEPERAGVELAAGTYAVVE